jgi:hypothetical protein
VTRTAGALVAVVLFGTGCASPQAEQGDIALVQEDVQLNCAS